MAARVGSSALLTRGEKHDQDRQHPEAGEDAGPARDRAGSDVHRGLADRAADRLAGEHGRRQVADALGGEVLARPSWLSVGVGHRLAHAIALDEHDGGDRRARRHDAGGEQAEGRQLGTGSPAGISPVSPTLSTSRPSSTAATVGISSASTAPYDASGVRMATTSTAMARRPTASEALSISPDA